MIGVDPVVNSFVLPEASKALDMSSPMRALASSIATLILTAGLLGAGALGDKIDASSSDSDRTKAMDARLTKLCDNMKAAKITIYTVRIDMKGSSAPTALANCASSPEKFFDIDSSGLSKAFESIAGSIGDLRIAE